MKTIYPEGNYNISEYQMSQASVVEPGKCANDPTRFDAKVAVKALKDRLEYNPFDPRTELSADAVHIASRIVSHLWIIFVLLPCVLGMLYMTLMTESNAHYSWSEQQSTHHGNGSTNQPVQ